MAPFGPPHPVGLSLARFISAGLHARAPGLPIAGLVLAALTFPLPLSAGTCIDYSAFLHEIGWLPCSADRIVIAGTHAYIASDFGFIIVDISDPSSPLIMGNVETPGIAQDVDVDGAVGAASGLHVVNVSNPTSPSILASAGATGPALGVQVTGALAFVAAGGAGLAAFDVVNPAQPMLIGATKALVKLR